MLLEIDLEYFKHTISAVNTIVQGRRFKRGNFEPIPRTSCYSRGKLVFIKVFGLELFKCHLIVPSFNFVVDLCDML